METFSTKVKITSITDRVISFRATDDTIDRDGEIVDFTGCDFRAWEKGNPNFLWSHDRWAFPIGKVVSWKMDLQERAILVDVYFPTVQELATDPEKAHDAAKLPDAIFKMYQSGMLNAVSIGFKSIERQQVEIMGQQVIKHVRWELYELSAVNIPANPSALIIREICEVEQKEDKEYSEKSGGETMVEKAGARLSKASRERLENIHKSFAECNKMYKACQDEMRKFMDEDMIEDEEEKPCNEPEPMPEKKGLDAIDFDALAKAMKKGDK